MTQSTIEATYRVTSEQISKCHRTEDLANHRITYLVDNSRGDTDADGNIIQYLVQWNPIRHRIECTCLAGQENMVCWHARGSLAHAEEYRQARILECERQMIELAQEMADEARAASPYTIAEDETSSSLDGVTFEIRNGRSIPMR